MSDFRSQLQALGDSESVQHGIASSVVAAAGTLIRPIRPTKAGRIAYRSGVGAYTAWELLTWRREGKQEIPSLPVRLGVAAGGAALAYRFAESGARLDAWMESKLRHIGFARPRVAMALGAGVLSVGMYLMERRGSRKYTRMAHMIEALEENALPWEEPGAVHRRLYAEMVSASGEYGTVLSDQFANSQVRPDPTCNDGCFDVRVLGQTGLIPGNVTCPISFGAIDKATGVDDNVLVLLWHEEGLVSAVEISRFEGDSHPPPEQLTVFDGPDEFN